MVAKAESATKQKKPQPWQVGEKQGRSESAYCSGVFDHTAPAFVCIYLLAVRRNGKIQFLQNEVYDTGR